MTKIRSKVHNYGDEKESDWPPKFGTGEHGSFYIDKKTGKCKKGHPPPREIYDKSPYIIGDETSWYRHPATGEWTNSRSRIKKIDEAAGTITTDKYQPPDPSNQRRARKERREDLHKSMHKAVAQIDAGTAPISEEVRQLCERQNEITSKALNFDAFNVAGRKNNAKGKKYRR